MRDVIERMCEAYVGAGALSHSYLGMTAAAKVLADELCRPVTQEEVDKFTDAAALWRGITNRFLAARHARIERPKTPEERVTVSAWAGQPFATMLDGQLRRCFGNREDAEIYRLGLIAKLKETQ